MAEPSIEDLARQVQALREQIKGLVGPSQLDNSSVAYAPGASFDLGDVAFAAADVETAIPGLTDLLASNEDALAAAREDVAAAIEAAQEASDAGVAAGELASAAADDALVKAQEALDAAAAAGGGATYSGSAPTESTPGKPGQQWFVWDSTYHVTSYYVYADDTTKWVKTVLDDGTFGNLSAGAITSGYLSAARIAAGSLTAAVLAADTITSREIAADAILARNIKAAEITGDKIAARTIAAGNIQAGTITGNEIKANSITADNIAANSITANEINLDTLNGKTIVGATILSAVSGPRLELSGSALRIYAATGTAAAATISADGDGGLGSYLTVNGTNNLTRIGSPTGSDGDTYAIYTTGKVQAVRGFVGDVQGAVLAGSGAGTVVNSAGDLFVLPGRSMTVRGEIRLGAESTYTLNYNGDAALRKLTVGNLASALQLRLTSTSDLSPSSTGHAFQIGPDTSTNLAMDNNEIMVRSNGSASTLYIQPDGGNVVLGSTAEGSVVYANGTLVNPNLPSRVAAGTVTYNSNVGAGSNASVTVSFPSGRFTQAPVITCSTENGRFNATPQGVSTTGFTISMTNVTSGAGVPGKIHWHAMDAG